MLTLAHVTLLIERTDKGHLNKGTAKFFRRLLSRFVSTIFSLTSRLYDHFIMLINMYFAAAVKHSHQCHMKMSRNRREKARSYIRIS